MSETAGFTGNKGPCTPIEASLASDKALLDFSTPGLMSRMSSGANVAPLPRKMTSDAGDFHTHDAS